MTSVQELKDQLKDIHARRARLEEQVSVHTARLEAAGVGMHGPLLDEEGFPRSDIDIPAIRADRNKVITLSNDHKELTSQLEMLLQKLHSQARDEGAPRPLTPPTAAAGPYGVSNEVEGVVAVTVDARSTRPFAVVDELVENSAAAAAGVLLRDELVRFGNVTGQTPNALQAVARVLQESEGIKVQAEFLRAGKVVVIVLEPRKGERLGCHLMPL